MAEDPREAAERKAQARVEEMGGAQAARALLKAEQAAVLTTLSQRRPGWPAASLVPYALDARGEPLLALSAISQHTRNLEADPRVCLFVYDAAAAAKDARTAARLAVYGKVSVLEDAAEAEAKTAYLARHPDARGLLNLDFKLYRLTVEEAQWVGGFAAAGWISRDDLLEPARA